MRNVKARGIEAENANFLNNRVTPFYRPQHNETKIRLAEEILDNSTKTTAKSDKTVMLLQDEITSVRNEANFRSNPLHDAHALLEFQLKVLEVIWDTLQKYCDVAV